MNQEKTTQATPEADAGPAAPLSMEVMPLREQRMVIRVSILDSPSPIKVMSWLQAISPAFWMGNDMYISQRTVVVTDEHGVKDECCGVICQSCSSMPIDDEIVSEVQQLLKSGRFREAPFECGPITWSVHVARNDTEALSVLTSGHFTPEAATA